MVGQLMLVLISCPNRNGLGSLPYQLMLGEHDYNRRAHIVLWATNEM